MTKLPIKNKIKIYRAIRDWTQEELANRVYVTRKTINTVENGKYVPSAYLALKIARAFGVPVEEVFQIDDGLSATDMNTPNNNPEK
jgi:putative transcriptional regulator